MKTKTLLKFSVLAAIPALFSTFMILIISFEWFFTGDSMLAKSLLTGNFNYKFTICFFAAGVGSIFWIMVALASTVRHADNIDRLEEARYDWYKSKKQYESATDKILSLQNGLTRGEVYNQGIEFLKFLAQDHNHKFATQKDAWDFWFRENISNKTKEV